MHENGFPVCACSMLLVLGCAFVQVLCARASIHSSDCVYAFVISEHAACDFALGIAQGTSDCGRAIQQVARERDKRRREKEEREKRERGGEEGRERERRRDIEISVSLLPVPRRQQHQVRLLFALPHDQLPATPLYCSAAAVDSQVLK